MTFGLIARADRGGLAAATWEIARHLDPARVLVVDLGAAGRGPTDPKLYADCRSVRVTDGLPDAEDAAWLARGCRRVFSFETLYSDAIRRTLAARDVHVTLMVNPELYQPADHAGVDTTLVLPTAWEAHRVAGAERVLPIPVDTAALNPRRASPQHEDVRLFHPAGSAFHDRNGTRMLLTALRGVLTEPTVLLANRPENRRRVGRARLVPIRDEPVYLDHWWHHDIDVLVLPRRYGGLSLPMQEAAAMGVPIITLDLEPQREWVPPAGLLASSPLPQARVPMKGGTFDVQRASPAELAKMIDRFVADADLRADCGEKVRAYAETISWWRLGDVWREVLG